jgi:hypothetical protein
MDKKSSKKNRLIKKNLKKKITKNIIINLYKSKKKFFLKKYPIN